MSSDAHKGEGKGDGRSPSHCTQQQPLASHKKGYSSNSYGVTAVALASQDKKKNARPTTVNFQSAASFKAEKAAYEAMVQEMAELKKQKKELV